MITCPSCDANIVSGAIGGDVWHCPMCGTYFSESDSEPDSEEAMRYRRSPKEEE